MRRTAHVFARNSGANFSQAHVSILGMYIADHELADSDDVLLPQTSLMHAKDTMGVWQP